LTATNQPDLEGHHYVTIFMGCRVGSSKDIKPRITEPTKCAGWHWLDWEEMKTQWERKIEGDATARKLFKPLYDLFEQRQDFRLHEHL
jgi:8-oxo-dGTP diphosphatase